MKIANPETYKWARRVIDGELVGEPIPVVAGAEGYAVRHGYRILEGEDERAAIALVNGEAPPAPVDPEPVAPASSTTPEGVKTTTNTNAAKAAKAAKSKPASTTPAE